MQDIRWLGPPPIPDFVRGAKQKRIQAHECSHVDTSGESQLQNLHLELRSTDFAPPAPALDVSPIAPAAGYGFARLAAGWVGDWHPSPKRQWILMLAGAMEFEVSSGEVYRADPGSVLLLEDTSGKGHRSRVVSDNEAVTAIIQL
jgi:hypothetical protein